MKKQLFFLGLFSLLSAHNPLISLPAASDTLTVWEETTSSSDQAIAQKILKALMDDNVLASEAMGIKVTVVNGNVTLQGKVSTKEIKKQIEARAQNTTGVMSINNKLETTKE